MSDIPSSGLITLNQMHTEAGGTSGTACTLNDSDIRGLIGKSSGVSMFFNEWYGAAAEFTVQFTITSWNTNRPGAAVNAYRGWQTYNNRGAATTAVSKSSFFGGADVVGYHMYQIQPNNNPATFYLDVNGTVADSDDSFAQVSVNGNNYSRSGLTYSVANGRTTWAFTHYPGGGFGSKTPMIDGTNTLVFTK